MKTTIFAWAVLLGTTALGSSAAGQPILERVEKLLREQVDAARQPAAPAEPGYLGLIADDSQDAGAGVRVLQVFAGQPAAGAGVRVGDLIVKIDGQPVRSMDDMARVLAGKTVGAKVPIGVSRQGAEQQLEVTLGRRPGTPEALPAPLPAERAATEGQPPGERRALGVRTVPVSELVRAQNRLPSSDGAQVISVLVGSPAEQAQIPLGAIVTAVDGQAVRSPNELAAAIGRTTAAEVELNYVHRGQPVTKRVVLAPPRPTDEGPQLQLRARPPIVEVPSEGTTTPPPKLAAPPQQFTPTAAETSQADDRQALVRRLEALEARLKSLEAQLEQRKNAPLTPPQIPRPE